MPPSEALYLSYQQVQSKLEKSQTELEASPDLAQLLENASVSLSPEERVRLKREFLDVGPLWECLQDSLVTEVIINSAKDIWIEKRGRLEPYFDCFLSEKSYRKFILKICQELQTELTLDQPFVNGKWRDFRVHIADKTMTQNQYCLSLRKQSYSAFQLEDLRQSQWCSSHQQAILENLIEQKKNILFIGSTSSGKTTAISAALKQLQSNERVVILEDTDELPLPNSCSTKLLTRKDHNEQIKEITLQDLIRQSLRMRPDRLVVGEVRGHEAKDLLLALATGHQGSMGTLHANSAHEALIRLEMLIQLGAPQWSLQAIRRLIQLSVHYLIVLRKNENHERKLDGIYKLSSLEEFGFLIETVDR